MSACVSVSVCFNNSHLNRRRILVCANDSLYISGLVCVAVMWINVLDRLAEREQLRHLAFNPILWNHIDLVNILHHTPDRLRQQAFAVEICPIWNVTRTRTLRHWTHSENEGLQIPLRQPAIGYTYLRSKRAPSLRGIWKVPTCILRTKWWTESDRYMCVFVCVRQNGRKRVCVCRRIGRGVK